MKQNHVLGVCPHPWQALFAANSAIPYCRIASQLHSKKMTFSMIREVGITLFLNVSWIWHLKNIDEVRRKHVEVEGEEQLFIADEQDVRQLIYWPLGVL